VVGRFLAITPSGIAAAASTGNNSMPQCSYTAHLAGGKRVVAVANIDTAPQAYFRLERAAVEEGQAFTSGKPPPPPQSVRHLGMDAFWFPVQTELMTTDGVRLITVSVEWSGVGVKRKQALAVALSRTYLRAPHGKATGYPSG
jgi:hypothetical protein